MRPGSDQTLAVLTQPYWTCNMTQHHNIVIIISRVTEMNQRGWTEIRQLQAKLHEDDTEQNHGSRSHPGFPSEAYVVIRSDLITFTWSCRRSVWKVWFEKHFESACCFNVSLDLQILQTTSKKLWVKTAAGEWALFSCTKWKKDLFLSLHDPWQEAALKTWDQTSVITQCRNTNIV